MATVTAVLAAHSTLTASTIETVNISGSQSVLIRNRGSVDMYYTYASAGGTAAAPAVANDSYICAAGAVIRIESVSGGITQVKLFSTGTPAYSVEGF